MATQGSMFLLLRCDQCQGKTTNEALPSAAWQHWLRDMFKSTATNFANFASLPPSSLNGLSRPKLQLKQGDDSYRQCKHHQLHVRVQKDVRFLHVLSFSVNKLARRKSRMRSWLGEAAQLPRTWSSPSRCQTHPQTFHVKRAVDSLSSTVIRN